MNWSTFWSTYRRTPVESEADLFYQVGKTAGGRPIPSGVFEQIVSSIISNLSLRPDDRLLDLCCGNGLVTAELAARVGRIVAVDFAQHLIDAARQHRARPNINYIQADVLACADQIAALKPTKVLLSDALAYFGPQELSRLLVALKAHAAPGALLLMSGIPNRRRMWRFYDTPRRRLAFLGERLLRRDSGMGRWWRSDEIHEVLSRLGLQGRIDEDTFTHYRMDVLVRLSGSS